MRITISKRGAVYRFCSLKRLWVDGGKICPEFSKLTGSNTRFRSFLRRSDPPMFQREYGAKDSACSPLNVPRAQSLRGKSFAIDSSREAPRLRILQKID